MTNGKRRTCERRTDEKVILLMKRGHPAAEFCTFRFCLEILQGAHFLAIVGTGEKDLVAEACSLLAETRSNTGRHRITDGIGKFSRVGKIEFGAQDHRTQTGEYAACLRDSFPNFVIDSGDPKVR